MYFRSPSPEKSRALARWLGVVVEKGGVVALVGPLGAGKSVFARGLAEGLGIDPRSVASPSFVIASEYPVAADRGGVVRFAHVDFYRLESQAELDSAGFDDLLAPDVLTAVEWADRFPERLPIDRLVVRIGAPEDSRREIRSDARGPWAAQGLARWRAAVAADSDLKSHLRE